MSLVINSGGLGDAASPTTATLTNPNWANACGLSYLSYITDPNCWGYSYSDWQTAFYNPPGSPISPSVVAALPTPPDCTQYEIAGVDAGVAAAECAQAVSDQQLSQTQANVASAAASLSIGDACQQASVDWPWPVGAMTCPSMAMWGLAVVLGVFFLSGRMR